jgi:23S rRNA (pseudouridine1915-N3)-methyltransferase
MKIRIVCVGRKAHDPLLVSAEEYLKRLTRYTSVELVRVKEGRSPEEESLRVQEVLSPQEHIVVLDEKGKMLTSMQCADTLRAWQHGNVHKIAFVVGGAEGLDAQMKQKAHTTWALSAFTLPHRLALVVLIEQLYRAHTLLKGEQYHKP